MTKSVLIIGAGMGGLAAATDLARQGLRVIVLERAGTPGGKMRSLAPGPTGPIDAGPTVFTMRWVFESLFADAGQDLHAALDLQPASLLARHAWRAGARLDLFADIDRSADAIAAFAGLAEAQGYRDFCARSAAIYRTLKTPFIAAQKPNPLSLVRRVGDLRAMWQTAPLSTMWGALGQHFKDPRLRQLFGRYATYCGSSPLQAPATLMLVAHVEQDGVWRVGGGMHQLARALQSLATAQGAQFRFNADVKTIRIDRGRATGVTLASGESLDADAIVFNGDCAALPAGLLGDAARHATRPVKAAQRSLSAITWCASATTEGFPLAHHNVFFAENYAEEFNAIFRRRAITADPTLYICAQDRDLEGTATPSGPERLLLLINAPADGDTTQLNPAEYEPRVTNLLRACGLTLHTEPSHSLATSPTGFATLFPGSGGALYGRVNHGGFASFLRPGAASNIPGLFFAGGSVHPGPGIPMATLSGRLAAARVAGALGV